MNKIIIVLFAICFGLVQCSNKSNSFKSLEKGKVLSRVCAGSTGNSYAVYIPKSAEDKPLPVIVCFDPKGDGSLPVKLFRMTAEKYKVMVVGSNVIKNGMPMPDVNYLANELFKEIKQNLPVDSSQFYLAGFSGGSRVALYLTSSSVVPVKGIIACSAGGEALYLNKNIVVAALTGDSDMNYLEMKQFADQLGMYGISRVFYSLPSVHQWPDSNSLANAFADVSVMGMANSSTPMDSVFVKQHYLSYNQQISALSKHLDNSDSLKKAVSITVNGTRVFRNFPTFNKIELFRDSIESLPAVKSLYAEAEKMEQAEKSGQEKIYQLYSSGHYNELLNLLDKLANEKKQNIVASRLLAYCSLMSYSYVGRALQANDLSLAKPLLEIYHRCDPENKDYFRFLEHYKQLGGK
jgi:poly(3-hydroxybutyrate) depolymerase